MSIPNFSRIHMSCVVSVLVSMLINTEKVPFFYELCVQLISNNSYHTQPNK